MARERALLLEDIRSIAGALSSLAEDAAERFPPEPESAGPQVSTPAAQATIDGYHVEANNVHPE